MHIAILKSKAIKVTGLSIVVYVLSDILSLVLMQEWNYNIIGINIIFSFLVVVFGIDSILFEQGCYKDIRFWSITSLGLLNISAWMYLLSGIQ